jgi:hypothetical protein
MTAGRLVIPLLIGGILVLMGGSAGAARRSVPHLTATGTVTSLSHTQIHVGHRECKLGAGGITLTVGFSVGDRVTISCLRGALRSIKQASTSGAPGQPGSTSISSSSVGNSASSVSSAATQTTTGGPSGSSAKSFSIAWATGDTSGGSTVTATGPITALDSSGITIGGVTCPFPPSGPGVPFASAGGLLNVVSASAGVGDKASFTCTTASGGSSGKISSA